jgi:hypothetical protein
VGLAEILTRKLMLWGTSVPQSIISARGPQFTSKFWAAFCHHLHINRYLSIAYLPQIDRQTECQDKIYERYLRIYVN